MRYTTIFLDFDDTLIDTQGYAAKCLESIYVDHNIKKYYSTYTQFLTEYSKHTHQLWDSYALGKIDKETLLKERFTKPFQNFTNIEQGYLENMNKDFMSRVVKIDFIIDGAKETLDHLKPKYKIVMLSNGFSELQYQKMESVGFTKYFDEVILSDVVGVNKPHPDIFDYALNKIGSTSDETIMIGDNILADIEGAMNSGIDQIWYNPKNEPSVVKPTHIVNHLKEIIDIL